MKVHSIFRGSAVIGTALLSCFLTLSATTLSAETLHSQTQQPTKIQSTVDATAPEAIANHEAGHLSEKVAAEEVYVVGPTPYVATAYSLRGRTASGRMVAKGLIAADPRHLPLGSRVRIEAGTWSGEYLVADTGTLVRGKRIDIWTPSTRDAMRFGRRTVKLTVLSYPAKKRATKKI